jgi:DNA-binding NarL/FixJ family response regulator
MEVQVLIVDDHTIVRNSLRAMLEKAGEFRVVGEAGNGVEAIDFCRKSRPDIVLMDLSMPVLNGVDATAELNRHFPGIRVVVLSAYDEEKAVVDVIRAGARGYLLKRAGVGDLLDAMRAVAAGGSYLSPQISSALMTRLQSGDTVGRSARESLSPRESQVMRLIAQGLTSKEIASALTLGVETVRSYRKTLMKKLGVTNAAGITRLAVSEPSGSPG